MSDYNWNSFTQRININVAGEKIYEAIATRLGMQKWFLRKSEFSRNNNLLAEHDYVKAGDTYKWLWFGYDDSVNETGEIVKANDVNEIQFTFGKAGNVIIQIHEEDNEVIVELTQSNIPDDDAGKYSFHVGCSTGWTFYLANLKSILEGGIDLRNKNIQLKRMLNS